VHKQQLATTAKQDQSKNQE